MLEAQREDFMSSWTGVSSGARTPILVATRSTYHAEPMPRMSEMVFPSAAAAIVDRTIIVPMVISM